MKAFSTIRLPLFAVVCALLWGSAFPVIKSVYQDWEFQSLELRLCFAGLRFMLSGLIILPFCYPELRRCQPGYGRLLVAMALTQTFLQYVFFYSAMAVSSGVLGSILVGTGSLWWVVLAPYLLGTPSPTWQHWSVLAVCSVGILIAVYAPGVGSGSAVLGTFLFLGASLAGALGAIVVVPLSRFMDVRLATSISLFGGGALLLLCGARALPTFWELSTPSIWGRTVYLAAVSGSAFGIWNWLVREYSVNVLAGYRFLIPLSAVIQSSLFIAGEVPGIGIWVGGALILGSLIVLQRFSRREA